MVAEIQSHIISAQKLPELKHRWFETRKCNAQTIQNVLHHLEGMEHMAKYDCAPDSAAPILHNAWTRMGDFFEQMDCVCRQGEKPVQVDASLMRDAVIIVAALMRDNQVEFVEREQRRQQPGRLERSYRKHFDIEKDMPLDAEDLQKIDERKQVSKYIEEEKVQYGVRLERFRRDLVDVLRLAGIEVRRGQEPGSFTSERL